MTLEPAWTEWIPGHKLNDSEAEQAAADDPAPNVPSFINRTWPCSALFICPILKWIANTAGVGARRWMNPTTPTLSLDPAVNG